MELLFCLAYILLVTPPSSNEINYIPRLAGGIYLQFRMLSKLYLPVHPFSICFHLFHLFCDCFVTSLKYYTGNDIEKLATKRERTEGSKEGTPYIYPKKSNQKKKYKRMGITEQITRNRWACTQAEQSSMNKGWTWGQTEQIASIQVRPSLQ